MKNKIRIALIFTLLLFTFSSFSQKVSNSAFDIAKAKKELEAVNRKISEYFDKGDANGLASIYSSDAYMMPDKGPIVKGKENITKAWSEFINSCKAGGIEIGGIEITIKELSGDNNILTDVGEFVFISKSGAKFWKGKYIEVWKNENSQWKVHREMTNSNEPDISK
jgi:ketosteroid isomerase-like protein